MTERILPREFPTAPKFIIPLSNAELQELGTFTALWSQLDWIIMLMVSHLAKIELGTLQLMMESMTTGPRVGLLQKLCKKNPNPTNDRIYKLCTKNGGLIEDRNHIIHGLWAVEWHANSTKDAQAACLFQKGGRNHIPATKLKTLSDRAANFSSELGECLAGLQPNPVFLAPNPSLFLFGKQSPGNTPPPPWPPEQSE